MMLKAPMNKEKNKVYKLVKNKEVIGYYSYLLTHKNTVKLDNKEVSVEDFNKMFEN